MARHSDRMERQPNAAAYDGDIFGNGRLTWGFPCPLNWGSPLSKTAIRFFLDGVTIGALSGVAPAATDDGRARWSAFVDAPAEWPTGSEEAHGFPDWHEAKAWAVSAAERVYGERLPVLPPDDGAGEGLDDALAAAVVDVLGGLPVGECARKRRVWPWVLLYECERRRRLPDRLRFLGGHFTETDMERLRTSTWEWRNGRRMEPEVPAFWRDAATAARAGQQEAAVPA